MISKNTFSILRLCEKISIHSLLVYGLGYASLSYILIILNGLGNHQLAILIAVLQSALTIVTIGFSANSRSLILSNSYKKKYLLKIRILISLFAALIFSVLIFSFNTNYSFLLLLLALRKLLDWIEELFIIDNSSKLNLYYFTIQLLFITFFPFLDFNNNFQLDAYLIIWNLSTIILFFNSYLKILIPTSIFSWKNSKAEWTLKIFFATLLPTLIGFAYRYRGLKIFDIQTAAKVFSSLSISGAFTSFVIYAFLPDFIFQIQRSNKNKIISTIWASFFLIIITIAILVTYLFRDNIDSMNLSYKFLILGFVTGIIYLFSNIYKVFLVQKYKISTLAEETTIALVVLTLIIFSRRSEPVSYYIFIPFIGAIISLIIYDIKKVYLINTFEIKKFLYIILFFVCNILIALLLFNQDILFKSLLFKLNLFFLLAVIFLFFDRIFKRLFSSFNSLLFLSFILLSYIAIIENYLHDVDRNFSFYIFIITIFMTQYLYTNICRFINLNFTYYVILLYLISSTFFFTL